MVSFRRSIISALAVAAMVFGSVSTSGGAAAETLVPDGSEQSLTASSSVERPRASFTAKAGRTLTVTSQFPSDVATPTLSLRRPNGKEFARFTAGTFGVSRPLDVSGVWSLVVVPVAGSLPEGSLVTVYFQLSYMTGVPVSIKPGATRGVGIIPATEVKVLTFTGKAGRRPTATLAPRLPYPSDGGRRVTLRLFRPDGTLWGSAEGSCASQCGEEWLSFRPESDSDLLDVDGTWTLAVSRWEAVGRDRSLRLDLVRDQKTAITPGVAVPVAITTRGQQARYTFTAKAGQRVGLSVSAQKWDYYGPGRGGGSVTLTLVSPAGVAGERFFIDEVSYDFAEDEDYFESGLLTATGTWTVVAEPNGQSTGSQTMSVSLATDRPARSVAIGESVTVPLGTAANQDLLIPAQPGRRIVLDVLRSSWASPLAGGIEGSGRVGATLGGVFSSSDYDLGQVPLPSTGAGFVDLPEREPTLPLPETTWTVRLSPRADSRGTITLRVRAVDDVRARAVIGVPVTVTTTEPGQHGLISFTTDQADQSRLVQVRVTANDYPAADLSLIEDLGGFTRGGPVIIGAGPSATRLAYVAAEPNGYTLDVDPSGSATGSISLVLEYVPE